MASVSITSTPTAVTIPPGSPVTVSASCTLGLTSAGAASGPTVSGNFFWPGVFVNNGGVTFYVVTASSATLTYPS